MTHHITFTVLTIGNQTHLRPETSSRQASSVLIRGKNNSIGNVDMRCYSPSKKCFYYPIHMILKYLVISDKFVFHNTNG